MEAEIGILIGVPIAPFFQNKPRSAVFRPCFAEQFVVHGNPLISLGRAVNALQHETGVLAPYAPSAPERGHSGFQKGPVPQR